MQKIKVDFQSAETQFKRLKFDFERMRPDLYRKNTLTCQFCFDQVSTSSNDQHYICTVCVRFIRGLQEIKKSQINWYCAICYQSTKGLPQSQLYGVVKRIRDLGSVHQYNHLQCVKSKLPGNIDILSNDKQLKLL